MAKLRLLVLMLGLIVLAACTPSHTAQKSELYARQVGLTNQYAVSRWHNRRISPDNRLLVVVSQPLEFESGVVSAAVAKAFSSSFSAVDALPSQLSSAAARREAMKLRYHFVIDITRVDIDAPQIESESTEGEQTAPPAQQLNLDKTDKVKIEMALVDVVSGKVVDKFLVTAKPSYFNFSGKPLDQLLAKPLGQLANDLTGS